MKKTQVAQSIVFFFLAISIMASCKKQEDAGAAVTEEEAVAVVSQAVLPESGGIAVQVADAASMAGKYSSYCGVTRDTSIVRSSVAGALVSYQLSAAWSWTLTCAASSRFSYSFQGSCSYDAPRVSSDDRLSATLSITGIEPAVAKYTVNTNLTRKGTQVAKVRRQNSFSSELNFTGTNVEVDKTSRQIVAGTLAVTLSGSTSGGRSFNYSGTLVFKGNKTAALTLGNSTVYSLQWQ